MGEKFEVLEWAVIGVLRGETVYQDSQRYFGSSLIKALLVMWKLKRAGAGCVTLKWR